MKINTDLSYNVYSDVYVPIGGTSYPTTIVSPPTRNQVSTDYRQILGGSGQTTFFTNLNLVYSTGTTAVIANAYPKNSNTIINNIYFFSSNTGYNLEDTPTSSLSYKLVNKRNTTESTDLGTDLCGNNLCRFILDTTSNPPTTLTSAYRVGFTGADTLNNATNSYFEMSISASKDATQFPGGTTAEAYRLRGWYLGVDVDNLKVKLINLTNYPDISNNVPSYNDWNITLTQDFAGSQANQTLTYGLRIGEKPTIPVSISNFTTTQQTPTLTTDFFGIERPNQTTISTWPVSSTLSGLNPTWRPVQSQWLMNGALFYASAGSAAAGNNFDTYGETWSNTHPTTVNMSQNVQLLKSSLTSSSHKYSRDRNFTPQFYITGTYNNNVTLSPSSTTVTPLNISFNSKQLWWDFTTLNTTLPFVYTLHSPGAGEYPTNYTSYNQAYSHITAISDTQLMWCKTGFTAGNYTTVAAENPYIDYTVYYGQTIDYSSKNTTGISKNLSYTATNDDYYEGGTKTITGTYKWMLLSNIRASASNFGRVVVNGTGGTSNPLKLGDDYLLYIQEIDSYFSSANNTIPSGYASGRSGWKAVQGTWDQGATVQLNNADEAGAYRRTTNTGTTAINFIKFYSPNSNANVFYRIGVKNGSNIKITNVTISYGTN